MARYAVTGGSGFLGGWVVDYLALCGHDPVVFDHLGRRVNAHVDGEVVGEVETFLGDVRDATAVTELAAHVDGIIHLAAVLGTQETIANPRPSAETNVQGGLNVFEACAQYDLPCVYIGVGNHWMLSSYAISKTCVERYAAMFNRERGTRINVVRPMNAYGPRQAVAPPFGPAKVRKITPAFVCRALCGMPIEVYGDGEQVSDLVYAGDVAKVLVAGLLAAAAGEVWEQVVEVGPAESSTVNETAALVARLAAWEQGAVVPLVHLPMRPGEEPGARVSADVETLRKVGIDPAGFVPLSVGLGETVDWYAEHEGTAWTRPWTS